jgi:putative transposase
MMPAESSIQDLLEFIQQTQDARELKRALAVKMTRQGTLQKEIMALLQVTSGFISKWKGIYEQQGAKALKLGYQGGASYLRAEEQAAIIEWLQQKDYWQIEDLQRHLWQTYQVEFRSRQSYYELMAKAGLSWKKSHISNPKHDEAAVEAKKSKSSDSCNDIVWHWNREQ